MKEHEYKDMVAALAPHITIAFDNQDDTQLMESVAEQMVRVRALCVVVRNTYRGYHELLEYQNEQRELHPRITYEVSFMVEDTLLPDRSELVRTVQLQMSLTHESSDICQRFFERYACALLEPDQHIMTSHKCFCNQENILLAIVQPKSRAFLKTATVLTDGEWNALVYGNIPGRLWNQEVAPKVDIDQYIIM